MCILFLRIQPSYLDPSNPKYILFLFQRYLHSLSSSIMPKGAGTVFLFVLAYWDITQDSPWGSCTWRDRVTKVKHPCASLFIWSGSFSVLSSFLGFYLWKALLSACPRRIFWSSGAVYRVICAFIP